MTQTIAKAPVIAAIKIAMERQEYFETLGDLTVMVPIG
jgi:hypothetical protein